MKPADLIRALNSVPAKELKIFGLVGEVVDENGDLDSTAMLAREVDIDLAVKEAQWYREKTEEVRNSLNQMVRRLSQH